MKVSDGPMSCGNESVYLHTVGKSEEASTYQELDLSKNAYQNITIRWSHIPSFVIFKRRTSQYMRPKNQNKKLKKKTTQKKTQKKNPSKP